MSAGSIPDLDFGDAKVGDAQLALTLFLSEPAAFGGIILRGAGPVRDAMLAHASAVLTQRGPVQRIPLNVDAERLLGGLDLTATLAAGRAILRQGLLDAATGGTVVLPMAERAPAFIAAHVAQALDSRRLSAILLDDGLDADEAPPALLAERIAFHCNLGDLRSFDPALLPLADAAFAAPPSDAQLARLATLAAALGVRSARALNFAHRAARAHAALWGRAAVEDEDIAASIRLVLSPRATMVPEMAAPPQQEDQPQPEDSATTDADETPLNDHNIDDILLDAAAAAIPPHIFAMIEQRQQRGGKGQPGKAGMKQKSALRGRPLTARAGVPGQGKRLALIDTLRCAAPWQTIRRASRPHGTARAIEVRKADLRIRNFEQRSESLTIFAVDASGSSALARLAEAKGAVELMLAQAYVKRSQVALVAFRHADAELLLPPTRSLTRARRALSALPGGGGTPLAKGLMAAQSLAEAAVKRGQTPTLAILTDGKANIGLDGNASRDMAMADARDVAKRIAAEGLSSIVIDISPRPRPEAAELATALNGRYLPLPHAGSAAMVTAIEDL